MEVSNFLSRFEMMVGKNSIDVLAHKTVLIVGIGGVGGYVCEALARSGVGHLILIDSDVVEITNLNRQIVALRSTLGKKKVEVMKDRILDINPQATVDIYDMFLNNNNLSFLDSLSLDFLVDCCDTVSTKEAIITYCLNKDIPFITCLGTAKKMDPSLLEITELKKTYNDPLAKILRKYVRDYHIVGNIPVLFSRELPCSCQGLGSSAFVPSSAGLLIASYVISKFIK